MRDQGRLGGLDMHVHVGAVVREHPMVVQGMEAQDAPLDTGEFAVGARGFVLFAGVLHVTILPLHHVALNAAERSFQKEWKR